MSKESIDSISWSCHKQDKAVLIGTGLDSNVYRLGDFVVKNYKFVSYDDLMPELNKDLLISYYQITNLAQKFVDENPLFLHLRYSKSLPLTINPFLEMHECDACGGIEGVAHYINGPNLKSMSAKFRDIKMEDMLSFVSRKLENRLKVRGIDIIPENVKVSDQGSLIVTDLCADISILRSYSEVTPSNSSSEDVAISFVA